MQLTLQATVNQLVEEKRMSFFEDEVSSLEQLIIVNEKRLLAQKTLFCKAP